MATFYIEAVENTDIALVMVGAPTIGTVKYGVNDTTCPNTYTVTTESTPISLTAGQKCYWTITSTSTAFSNSNYLNFTSTAKISVCGNLSDLIGGDTQIPRSYCFYKLFYNCTKLVDASNLVVVNDFNSKSSCYRCMFDGCTSLTAAPRLPATTLTGSCYCDMFYGCTSLTATPELPATTLTYECYAYMFKGCTSLTTAPTLPATTLESDCYSNMFNGCTSLTTPPELPATTLASWCYGYMFQNCTSLTTAPELPATTLANYCYTNMFNGCTSLTTAPALSATTLASSCYYQMFYNCASLTTAPALPATTLAMQCYYQMFYNCAALTTAPALSATTLESDCYYQMFCNCTSLTTAPELPATTLASECYRAMFQNCTSLTTAPELPATTLTPYCYTNMFNGCTSLTTAPALPATTLANYCYSYMFYNCTSLTTAPALPATTFAMQCYAAMFQNCTNIKLSETQTAPYSIPYRIPSEGTGTEGTGSLNSMFYNTGGTFKGTPTINTTYYLAPYATFYIEAVENTDITLSKSGTPTVGDAYYGVNDHNVPNAYTYGDTIHLIAGQKCYWFVTSGNAPDYVNDYIYFTSTAKINVGGSMSDLIGGETKIPADYCLVKLFYNCKQLVDASNLVAISNLNSKEACYYQMFYGCTSLTAIPKLPATILTDSCYDRMFCFCTSLTIPPELPATTLADSCYERMFYGCTSLTIPPELPATTVNTKCYYEMFSGCTSLTTAPELPATVLAKQCYRLMFYGCTSLTIPPELPATTLAAECYSSMFSRCTSLVTLPKLPATTLENECYGYMFYNCTKIKLSETQTAPYSISYRIPSEGTGTVGTNSLTNMFTGTGGTFTGTPTINTVYYMDDYSKNVQLYDDYIKLYPITKAENVMGLDEVVSDTITDQKGAANGIASLGSDGKVQSDQLPQMDYIPTDQKGEANGVASLGADGKVPSGQLPEMDYIPTSQRGAANGIASLGSDGKVQSDQLPAMDYQPTINVSGILKGNGAGGVSAAVAGTDFAPGGFGFGEPLPNVEASSASESYETFCAKIDAKIQNWENRTTGLLNIYPPQMYGNGKQVCVVCKMDANYATIYPVGNYDKAFCGWRMFKSKNYSSDPSGVWQPLEWVNPPMTTNVVYRTTERRNGLPVYKKQDSNGVQYWSTDQTNWNAESNVKIETGSYVGTGTYGENNPNSLTFGFAPKVVLLFYMTGKNLLMFGKDGSTTNYAMFSDLLSTNYMEGYGFSNNSLTYPSFGKKSEDGKTFSWYNSGGASWQLNVTGTEYHYIAIC